MKQWILVLLSSGALHALLVFFIFLYYLLKESKPKQRQTLSQYIGQRTVVLLLFPICFLSKRTAILLDNVPVDSLIGFLISSWVMLICCGIMALVALYYLETFLLKRTKTFVGRQFCVFLSTTVAIAIPAVLVILLHLIDNPPSSLDLVDPWWMPGLSLLSKITFIAALRVFFNLIQYRIQSLVNQKDVEIARMKELKNQAELNALHSRINPHFLYNALNSIASLAHLDAGKTERMALGLSDLFRYSINKENKTYVTVDEELEMVNKYLDIEKTRFGDRLVYEIKADERVRNIQIPIFLIQPLVENAVKHGISKIKSEGRIVVEAKKDHKDLHIAIYDNGPDFPAEPVSGYGLQNLHDKLSIIYGDNAGINWVNGVDKHVTITLKHVVKS